VSEKKYFTLISGKPLGKAPQEKIIPQESFSELLTGKEVLEKVQEDALQYRQRVMSECEKLKEVAQKEGFEQGYSNWVQQVSYLEKEILRVHDEMMKLVMPIALKAAKKIVAAELQTTQDAIVNIVKTTLKSVAQHKKIAIYVNKKDFEILEKNKSQIRQLFEQLESLSIREREDIDEGGCVIETESGIINAQLKDRWISLEAAFESLGSQLLKGIER
jgi:type III secretion protein L